VHGHREGEGPGVGARERDRARGDVGRDHPRVGPLGRQRQRHRARPGADVEHAPRSTPRRRRLGERQLDQPLRLRSRDEHARAQRDPQPVEGRLAEHQLQRLTRRAPRQGVLEPRRLDLAQWPCPVEHLLERGEAGHGLEQPGGLALGSADARGAKPRGGLPPGAADAERAFGGRATRSV
jgi:hypothetical protein